MAAATALAIGLAGCTAATGATAPTSPPPSTAPTSPATTPPSRTESPDCQPSDFDPRPYYAGEGAAGSSISYVVVRSAGTRSCLLRTRPVLYDGTGASVPFRYEGGDGTQTTVTLTPGRYAAFSFAQSTGFGALQPSDPACQHPQEYRNLSVGLADGKRFPLPGQTVRFLCTGLNVRMGAWWLVDDLKRFPPLHQAATS
jgi:hypothetical protein